ncbi:MAG: YncE family protein, partial [Ktedonobacterales bacterium]
MLATLLLAYICALAAISPAFADGGAPNLAYVAGGGANGSDLDVIDMSKLSVSWHTTLDSAPYSVLLSPDSHELFATEPAANKLIFVGARDHHVDSSLTVATRPTAMALDLASSPNRLYVAEQGSNAVAVVDTSKRRVVATIPVGAHPSGVAVAGASSGIPNPHDTQVYVANTDSNSVSVIATQEQRVVATIAVPGAPTGVVIP